MPIGDSFTGRTKLWIIDVIFFFFIIFLFGTEDASGLFLGIIIMILFIIITLYLIITSR